MTADHSARFAKDRLDIGLMTDDPTMLDFVRDEVGLGPPEILRVNRATTQHRFDLRGSVVKVNVIGELETEQRTGYRELILADESCGTPRRMIGPDDVAFTVVPMGWNGIVHMAVRLAVPDVDAALRYFAQALRWEIVDNRDRPSARLGASAVLLEEASDAPDVVAATARGWTYLTAQVWDCDQETEEAANAGAVVVRPPRTYGEVARFSMVADPFGNLVELSQRASLTGPLPPNHT